VKEYQDIPVVGVVAVDGKNCRGAMLNDLSLAVFWTQFGLDQARLGGYTGPAAVVPLGVDLDVYQPRDRREARRRLQLPDALLGAFIVGNVNRNQPRKIQDAYLWLHVCPTGDTDGVDCNQLAAYHRAPLICVEPPAWYGVEDDVLVDTYNAFDVCLNPSQGEGFGLTTFEAMACGVPQILSDWAALSELCRDAAWMVPCTSFAATNLQINSIGGVMDRALAINALDALYNSPRERDRLSKAASALVREPRFRWENVGKAFAVALDGVLAKEAVA
jgi:D-inositol-3-phosphate glycosyltransferase